MSPHDEPFEFENRRGQRLCGTLTPSADGPSVDGDPSRAVLLIHGLGGHRNERHMVRVAHAIASAGMTALRVDLADNAGESSGRMRDMTISREVDDAEDALSSLDVLVGGRPGSVGVAGHSFGGMIAMLLAARRPERVTALVAMSAVFDAPARFRAMRAEREAEFRGRGVLQLGDNPEMALGPAYFDDLERWDIAAEAAKVRAPALILHGSDDDEVDVSEARAYDLGLVNSRHVVRVIEGGDHTYTDPRALDEVAATVGGWLGTVLA